MSRGAKIALIIVLCVLAIPIGIPLIAGVFGVLVGLIAATFGVFFAVGIVGVVLIVCGLTVTFIGFIKMMVGPGVGLLVGGIGLMMASSGACGFSMLYMAVRPRTPCIYTLDHRTFAPIG